MFFAAKKCKLKKLYFLTLILEKVINRAKFGACTFSSFEEVKTHRHAHNTPKERIALYSIDIACTIVYDHYMFVLYSV